MPRKIIVIDDNAIIRQMLKKSLEEEYEVFEAAGGKEALEIIGRYYNTLSAILTDIHMPEVDGYEVLRNVRENPLLSSIPVIMVTGSEDEESRVKALTLGANDFIVKPFNPEIVKHCVKNNIALRETASILNAIQKDKLTGLYNREAFFAKVGSEIKVHEPGYYILSCFDIDGFKLINDQYGAAEGDRILREIGRTLNEDMEHIGGFAGRISGDNFGVLIPYKSRAMSIARIIQQNRMAFSDKQAIVFSIGRYIITDISLSASAIYDRAYIAKQSVKGRYDNHTAYFNDTMLAKLVRSQQIVADMDMAIAERQFEVWFQPQRNHATGALVGAEALVRWRHPDKGLIPPYEFIPVFEQNGFIYELDKYVWEKTCRYLRKWIDDGGTPVPVSVNVSRIDILRTDFIEIITGLQKKYDIPVTLLRLEITESAFSQSTKQIVEIVKQLIDIGFVVEIDDFGSGYSSLNTLKCVPAQVVKLDMRFLEDNDDSGRGGNILESVVRMTKWLGMSIIAEGVETKEQANFLASIGCSYIQGYLYAKPMIDTDYEQYCKDVGKEERLLSMESVAHLDNNSFWNPKSMDTLIFNSYVGAACIFEYYNRQIELLRANSKFSAILGDGTLSVEDILKLSWLSHLTPDSLALVRDVLRRSAETGEEYTEEYVFTDIIKSQPVIYLRSTMRVIAVAGKRMLVYCTSENITAQRKAEENERKAEEEYAAIAGRLEAIMDNVNCGITAGTYDGDKLNYILCNDRYFELFGYTRQEYNSIDALSIIHKDDLQHFLSISKQVALNGNPQTFEYRAIKSDGSIIWIRASMTVTEISGVDNPVQIGMFYDITSEKNAARELLDNLPGGAGLYEYLDGKLSVIYLNKSYWKLVGRDEGNYSEFNALSAVHPDDLNIVSNEISCAIQQNRDIVCDFRLRREADNYLPVHLVGRILSKENGALMIYTSFSPISRETISINEMLPVAIKAMMGSSSDASFIIGRDLKFICCSSAFAKLAKLESVNLITGKYTEDIFPPEIVEQTDTVNREILRTGKSFVDREVSFPTTDGIKHMLFSEYPLLDDESNVLGIYGNGRDITETKRIQTRLELLTNNIPGGIAVYEGKPDALDKIKLTYFSDGFCRLFGYTRSEYEQLTENNPLKLVFSADISKMHERIFALIQKGIPMDCIYRAKVNGGAIKFINVRAVMGEPNGENLTVNAIFFDVTEQNLAIEKLKISEEVNSIAIRQSKNVVCRYEIASKQLFVSENVNSIFSIMQAENDIPDRLIREGRISQTTIASFTSFFDEIRNGKKSGKAEFQLHSSLGYRWVEAKFTSIFNEDGTPITAVISVMDITESIERDLAFRKWKQSLNEKDPKTYSLFRCNISKDSVLDSADGLLIPENLTASLAVFSERTVDYANRCVFFEHRSRFLSVMDRSLIMLRYRAGKKSDMLEYVETLPDGKTRWLRLTLDLVDLPSSGDIEAYVLFENIDLDKQTELEIIARAETDSLTGLLNRKTFEVKLAKLIGEKKPNNQSALFIIDLDGFKQVNDNFGHAVGDETLIEFAQKLKASFRRQDLICRLGGDEFIIFMSNFIHISAVKDKASLICAMLHKSFSIDIQLSASIGIAICPNDGVNFETLYKKADSALYHVKETGKDSYAFYNDGMGEKPQINAEIQCEHPSNAQLNSTPKRRMLIAEDNEINRDYLTSLFDEEFIIDTVADGTVALAKLRHYGSSISVVLLDIMMPGLDGFSVLKKMRESPSMQSIPVIVVSGMNEREAYLKAIREGASDYITKPVDSEILKLRVASVLSRSENEQLRARNRYLALQNEEAKRLADARRHSEELSVALHAAERADLAKGQFLSSMSHEIRTPLNAVIGYNTIAKNEMLTAKSDEELRRISMKVMDCLTKSEIASRHLLTIINDVLDMSAIESGKMKVDMSPFDFKSLIASLTVMFFSQAHSKGVSFEVLFGKPTEEWYIGDQLRINQILTNILSNAVKFTSEGGNVTMAVKEKTIDENFTEICFIIADTGIGMTKEYLSHIWTPFEQEEASISRRFGGTGLGLSITKNLVEMMGGTISVKSELGIGSEFTVKLILKRTAQPVITSNYDFSDINALVIDDDVSTCDYIKLLFDRCGANCMTFTSGERAVEAFAVAKNSSKPFNVCLVDWRMPHMDGFATISEIRRISQINPISANKLPIVVVTAYDFTEIAEQAEKLGISKFISKPLFQSSLFDLLVTISGKRITRSLKGQPKYDFGGARVLLAEDNNMNMEVAKHILMSVGVEVDSAQNGKEAVDIFSASAAGTYKAILMDIHMPEMDGYQATQIIRSSLHPDAKNVPIIAMTADVFAEDIAEAHNAGMNDHIAKPIEVDSMLKILMKYTGDTTK